MTPRGKPMPVRWREEILSEHGPELPITRLVLLALAKFMDRDGKAFPGQRKLASTSALNQRTVNLHLGHAESAGWIVRSLKGRGPRAGHKYQAAIPDPVVIREAAE